MMKFSKYLPFIFLALIPMSIGILAMMNNISGFNDTMKNIIIPMLSMSHVNDNTARTLRAIHHPSLIYSAYFIVMLLEFLVGVLSTIGVFKMLRHLSQLDKVFHKASIWVEYACLLGIIVWGFIFFCIGGDYFLSWHNPDLQTLQSGALMYVTLLAIIYFIFLLGPKHLDE
jgi:predicted small integral membrane protein